MKLFAKYLPVEGERKIGDTVIHQGNPPVEITASNESLLCPDCKKVKLFLCTKDIQVGDKVWNDAVNLECGIAEELHDNPSWDCVEEHGIHFMCISRNESGEVTGAGDLPITQLFKVIGEISPEAIWVKEGMEFRIEECAYIMSGNYYHEFKDIRVWDIEGMKKYPIAIKCSQCNTFH